jgi:hypothetical protein
VPEATLHSILMSRLDGVNALWKAAYGVDLSQLSLTKKLDVPSFPGPCNGRNLSVGYAMFHNCNRLVHRVTMVEQKRTLQRQLRH